MPNFDSEYFDNDDIDNDDRSNLKSDIGFQLLCLDLTLSNYQGLGNRRFQTDWTVYTGFSQNCP